MLNASQRDVLIRQLVMRKLAEERASQQWMRIKYKKYLAGGWIREDGTIAKPHSKAIEFHEACKDPLHQVFVLLGGRRSSKSFTGASEFASWIDGERPWDGSKTCPRLQAARWLIVAPTFSTHIPDVIAPYIEQRLGHLIVDVLKNQQKAPTTYILKNGASIRLNSYEQYLKVAHDQTNVFQSGYFDGVWCDEPPPREVWKGIKRGLVTGMSRGWGKAIIAGTLEQNTWIFDELYCEAHNKGGKNRRIWGTEFSIYDNPANTEEAIDQLAQGLSDEEKETILYGRAMHLMGRVYKKFDEHIHVQTWDPLIDEKGQPSNNPIIMAIDPAARRPWCMVWAMVEKDGTYRYVREWPTSEFEKMKDSQWGYRDYAKIIAEVEASIPGGKDRVIWRIMDPNYGPSRSQVGNGSRSVADEMALLGYRFDVTVDDDIAGRHHITRQLLAVPRPDEPISHINQPMLFIHKTEENPMRNMIWAFLHYIHDNYKDPNKAAKETPLDTGKDQMDASGYIHMRKPRWIDWQTRLTQPRFHITSSTRNSGL